MSPTREKIKNVLIAVLLVGMVYLTYAVWFYDSPFGEINFDSFFNFTVREEIGAGAEADLGRFGIRPLAIAISDGEVRRGEIYSSEKSDELYAALRPDFARIAKRGTVFAEVFPDAWEAALVSGGVLLDYRADVPVAAVWMWLGTSVENEGIYGRYFLLSTAKRNVTIYIKNASNGKIYSVQTDISSENLKNVISRSVAEKMNLALDLEDENFRKVTDEMFIPEAQRQYPTLSAYNSVVNFSTETVQAALEVFGLSDVAPTRFPEQDGTEVYIADRVTLKISPKGTATYTDTREETDEILGVAVECDGDIPTLAEKTEAARKLTASFASKLHGEGGIYIISVSEGAGGTEVIFGRHVGGIPVDMRETLYFSNILIKGKSVRSAKFNLCGYDKIEKSVQAIPERLVAAAVALDSEADLTLRYADTGEPEISFAWHIGGIERQNKKEE